MRLPLPILLVGIPILVNLGCSFRPVGKPGASSNSPLPVQLERFNPDQYRNGLDGKGFTLKDSDQVYFLTELDEKRAWVVVQGKKLELLLVKDLSTQVPDYMTVRRGAKYKSIFRSKDLSARAEYTLTNRFDACDFVRLEYRLDLTISNGASTQNYTLYNTSGG